MSRKSTHIIELRGAEAEAYVHELSTLRIRVFREFPYLYEGDNEYERSYLSTYFSCPESFIALCFDGDKVVGASTAIPMRHEEESFQAPFRKRGMKPESICYYGESVLLPEYRGQGIGKMFMEVRERYARTLPDVKQVCFCAVVREPDHPESPPGYRPLDSFWRDLGFEKIPGLTTTYKWREIGASEPTGKKMQFWLKEL